jgi:hypothetical protein
MARSHLGRTGGDPGLRPPIGGSPVAACRKTGPKRLTVFALIGALLLGSLSGCLVIGAAAVAAGVVHATSDASSEVVLERPWDQVFQASVDELAERGLVVAEDQPRGRIEGAVDSAKVVIEMARGRDETIQLTVTARRLEGLSPAPDVAQSIAVDIVKRLGY